MFSKDKAVSWLQNMEREVLETEVDVLECACGCQTYYVCRDGRIQCSGCAKKTELTLEASMVEVKKMKAMWDELNVQ